MDFLKSRNSYLAAPILFCFALALIFAVWGIWYPCPKEWIVRFIDNDGMSFVESATLGFFFLQLLCIWLIPPMAPGRRRVFWQIDFSLITFIAVARQLDWHKAMVKVSNLPGATTGTPFKMRFLTNPVNPLPDRLIVLFTFIVVIAVCATTLLAFAKPLFKGFFKRQPVCWSIAFLGGTTVLIQFFDRLPSIFRKKLHVQLSDPVRSLFSLLEEGLEVILPLLVILALCQAYFIFVDKSAGHLAE